MTPLHCAAVNGRGQTYKLIIKHVEDKNPTNFLGQTPLDFADEHKNIQQIYKTVLSNH